MRLRWQQLPGERCKRIVSGWEAPSCESTVKDRRDDRFMMYVPEAIEAMVR